MTVVRGLVRVLLVLLIVATVLCGMVVLVALLPAALAETSPAWGAPVEVFALNPLARGFSDLPFTHPMRGIQLAISVFVALLLLLLATGFVSMLLSASRRRDKASARCAVAPQPTEEMLHLQRGIREMSIRLESLETILLDRAGRG